MTDVLLDALSTVKRVVTYERVSSDEQRERQTILLQQAALERELEAHPECELVDRYIDDGVSGTVPFAKRPAGGRLLRDAELGLFDEVWIYDNSRLGREDVDPLLVRRSLTTSASGCAPCTRATPTPSSSPSPSLWQARSARPSSAVPPMA